MKKKTIYYLGICISLLLCSCYPNTDVYYEDTDVVFTKYDDGFDFASNGTYAMPDKIVKVNGDLAEGEEPEFLAEPFNTQILNQIEKNLTARGFTKVEDPADANMVLFPAVWSNTTINYWYNYWCWYYPYYCGWGWGYPTYTSYTTGTFVMTMVVDKESEIAPGTVWTAIANGVMSGANQVSRVTNSIDQAFEQSPYLNIN